MNKMLPLFLFTLLAFNTAYAAKGSSCNDIDSCIKIVSKLTGKSYVYTEKLKGSVSMTDEFTLNENNADSIMSKILNLNGYTRIPLTEDDGYMVVNARDIRYTPTPLIHSSKDGAPALPDNFDYHQMMYQPKEADPVQMLEFTRSIRPFLSRYGRVISPKTEGPMIIQDTAINLKRIHKILVQYDRKLSKEERKRREEWRKRDYEIKKLEAKNCASKKEVIKEYLNKK
jgi:type II secretory pathway component GspD/PulD (secretin)